MARKRKNLKDIAEEVGISTAMVSQILNGKGRASEKVLQQVQQLLEENDYKPKYQRKPVLFVCDTPHAQDAGWATLTFSKMLTGVTSGILEHGLNLHMEFIDPEQPKSAAQILEKDCGGIILEIGCSVQQQLCKKAAAANVPLIQIGYDNELPQYHAVVIDSYSGAYQGVTHLIQEGHTRIGCIRWKNRGQVQNSNKKLAGYRSALEDAGIDVIDDYIVDAPDTLSDLDDPSSQRQARVAVEQLLNCNPAPTAVFVENSFISASLLFPLAQDHGELPERIRELDIVHFEDVPIAPIASFGAGMLNLPYIKAKGLAVDWHQIGYIATNNLAQFLIKGDTEQKQVLRLSPGLVKYESGKTNPL